MIRIIGFIKLVFFVVLISSSIQSKAQITIPNTVPIASQDSVIYYLIEQGKKLTDKDSINADLYYLEASRLSDSLNKTEKFIESLYFLGIHYYTFFNYAKSLEIFSVLLEKHNQNLSDKMRADIQHYLGLSHIKFENYDRSLYYIEKALYYYETKNEKAEIAKIYKNLGNIYLFLNNEKLALPEYQKALLLYRELNDEEGIAMCYNNLGMIFTKLGNVSKALEYFNQALEIKKSLKNLSSYANTLGNIGDSYLSISNYDKAISFFNEALNIMIEINNPNGLSEIYNYLGNAYIKKGDYKKAFEFLYQGKRISEKYNYKQRLTNNYRLLSEAYYGMGDYKNAIENYKTYSLIKDSVWEAMSNQRLADYKIIYKNIQAENEVIETEKKFQRQRDQFFLILAILFFTLVFIAILLWQNSVIKRKSNKIQNINKELDERVQKKTSELRITQYSVDLAADAIIWMKNNGKFFYVNDSACALLDYKKSELEQMSIFDIVPEFTEDLWHEYWNQLKKNRTYIIQLYYRTKLGSDIPVETAFNFRDFEGEEYNFTFSRNITERKLAEEKLKNAKDKAERSDQLKSAFLANMSHEIRTPMNAITGFTNLLIDPTMSQKEKEEIAELIQLSSNDLLNLINDIIDISKIEADELTINKSIYSVNEILSDIYRLYSQDINIKHKNLQLTLCIQAENNNFGIYTDHIRFRQIMNNLLSNAIKFTDNGEISFGYTMITHGNHNLLKFFVKDTGIGISKENIELLFERYKTFNSDRKKVYKGTGLGLSISKKLVEMLGGEINVESIEGSGSTFYFTLPYQDLKINNSTTNEKLVTNKQPNWQNKSILIVEDTPSNYYLIESFLRPTKATIYWAKTGKEALEQFKEKLSIDLVLMDIQLPGINGYEAAKIIKAINASTPIIAQTAYALSGERELSKNEGCDDYISKPINQEKLINLLISYLGV
ncbi:MAG: tetratricopeptide repeat protein [Bacteroidales bacterium]|nr:tetratricopeptide repeat protein [Bacteroidales bacterium]